MSGGMPLGGTERTLYIVEAPIRKDGTIVLGTFGRGIGKFVIFELAEWKQLCADVPQLQTTKFRVATFSGAAATPHEEPTE